MIVEGLVPDPRRPGSTRVLVGGRPAWTVPADVIASLGLVVGQALRSDAVERLDRAADEEGAFRAGFAHSNGERTVRGNSLANWSGKGTPPRPSRLR